MSEPVFDERLMTAERLLKLAGHHSMTVTQHLDGVDATLDCSDCTQAITKLSDTIGIPYPITAQQILQDVLRHLVTHHDQPLSGKAKEDD